MEKFASSSFSDFTNLRELYRSQSGVVYKGTFKYDRKDYVLKERKLPELGRAKDIMNEIKLLLQLNHSNVLRCEGWFRDEQRQSIFMVLELCGGGDLNSIIQQRHQKMTFFEEHQIWFIFSQLCEGLKHLHEHGIVHRDLKPLNVFCSANGRTFKIGDLGVSRQVSEDTLLLKSFYGTPLYLSPELVESKPYNEKTDIWSLGVILYELCALEPPFKGSSLLEVARMVTQGTYSPIPKQFSQHMQRCISWMLNVNYAKRPNIMQVIEYVSARLTDKGVNPVPPQTTSLTAPPSTESDAHRKHRQVKSRSPDRGTARRKSPDRRSRRSGSHDCDADSLDSPDDGSDHTSITYMDQDDDGSLTYDQQTETHDNAAERNPAIKGVVHRRMEPSKGVIPVVVASSPAANNDKGRVVIGLDRLRLQLRRELKSYRKMLQLRDFVSVKPKYNHCNYTPPAPFLLEDIPVEAPLSRQPDESERLSKAINDCGARVACLEKAIDEMGSVELKLLKKLDLMSILSSSSSGLSENNSPDTVNPVAKGNQKDKSQCVQDAVTRLPFHPTVDDLRLKGVNVNEQLHDRTLIAGPASAALIGVESKVEQRYKGRRQQSSYLYRGNLVSPDPVAVLERPQTAAADYRVPSIGRDKLHRPSSAIGKIIVDENEAKKEALLLKWEQHQGSTVIDKSSSSQRIATGLHLPSMHLLSTTRRPHTVAPAATRAPTAEVDLMDKHRLKQHRRRKNDITSYNG